jgi:hypothetical protein
MLAQFIILLSVLFLTTLGFLFVPDSKKKVASPKLTYASLISWAMVLVVITYTFNEAKVCDGYFCGLGYVFSGGAIAIALGILGLILAVIGKVRKH